MSTALSTSKRKFDKLLQNLTATPNKRKSTSDAVAPATKEPPAKRLKALKAALANREQPSAPSALLIAQNRLRAGSTTSLRSSASKDSLIDRPRKAPNYAPWSQEQFLARLKTFSDVRKWSSKPDRVNEVEWAKRGWICEERNKVACKGGCEKRIVVHLEPRAEEEEGTSGEAGAEDETEGVEDALIARYAGMTVTGHEENCLWRRSGCRDDIHRIPLASRDKAIEDLRNRTHSMQAVQEELKSLPEPHLPNDISLAKIRNALPEADAADSSDTALGLALCGLRGVTQFKQNLLCCESCFARRGLWTLKKSDETEEHFAEAEGQMTFSPLEVHRGYCPWVNGASQHNLPGPFAGLSGYETLVKRLQQTMSGQRRPETPASTNTDVSPKSKEETVEEDRERFSKWAKMKRALNLKKPTATANGTGLR